jgi:hypothetical protein
MATLVRSLTTLRAELNRLYPGRDKSSDGWIGDAAHARTESDHNADSRGLVHAFDADADLDPDDPEAMDRVVDYTVDRHRAGRDRRLTYVIWCPRSGPRKGVPTIWSARRGWKPKDYTGSNRHDKHAHFSADDIPALENSGAGWHLEDTMPLTPKDIDDIADKVVEKLTKPYAVKQDAELENILGRAALTQPVPNRFRGKRTDAYVLLDDLAAAVQKLQETPPTTPARASSK